MIDCHGVSPRAVASNAIVGGGDGRRGSSSLAFAISRNIQIISHPFKWNFYLDFIRTISKHSDFAFLNIG